MLHYIQASTEQIVLQNTTSYIDQDMYPKKYKIWLLFYIDTLEKAIHCIHEDYLTLLWYTGGCMSKRTKKKQKITVSFDMHQILKVAYML